MYTNNDLINSEKRWAIDLEWLQANNRSITTLAKGAVCAKCRKKLKIDYKQVQPSELFKSVKACCPCIPGKWK
jgi:hypothetical protein